MNTFKILERSRNVISNAISKIDQQISDVREKYPYEVYGLRGEEKADRLKEGRAVLQKHLDAWDNADRVNLKLEQMNIQLQQKQRCIEELQAALHPYDPAEAERIRRRWRQ